MTPIGHADDTESVTGTLHHIWHEVLGIFGPVIGVCLVIAVALTGLWIYCRRKNK